MVIKVVKFPGEGYNIRHVFWLKINELDGILFNFINKHRTELSKSAKI